jgi:uncharacterized protein (DUF1800 family)
MRFFIGLLLLFLLVCGPEVGFAVTDAPKPKLTNDQRTAQVLSRLTFGARPGDFERVRQMGIDVYIKQQLDPDSIDDSALDKRLEKLPTLNLATPTIAELYNPPKPKPTPIPEPLPAKAAETSAAANIARAVEEPNATSTPKPKPTPPPKNPGMVVNELQRAKLLRAVYSERQLYELMVDFWENHFSIFANKDADRLLLTGFDREAVRPFAMGNFRDLLGATAHSPAMLYYLDNWTSSVLRKYPATKDKPARQSGGINENYARELMELHTLGVNGGYTQKDVQEVARCFTGWTIRKPNEEGVFIYNPALHDNGEKVVLGVKIPAGGGISDGERVLDILAKHPSTAHFIATKIARRFLGDDPPKAAIDRAAQVFLTTNGSISETLKSIITSPAFFSPAVYRNKVRSPFEYVAAALRITNADTDADRPILSWISRMGQPVYGRVTPDGYPDKNSEWLSNNDLLTRFNFAGALATNSIKGTKVDAKTLLEDTDANDPLKVESALSRLILTNEVTDHTKAALEKIANDARTKKEADAGKATLPDTIALAVQKPAAKQPNYVLEMLSLVLGTPEFQRK